MTFTVQGSKADAVVNIVYAKKGYREVVDYLGINWDSDKSGSSTNIVTIPLEGKPKKFSVGEEVRKHNQALIKKNK